MMQALMQAHDISCSGPLRLRLRSAFLVHVATIRDEPRRSRWANLIAGVALALVTTIRLATGAGEYLLQCLRCVGAARMQIHKGRSSRQSSHCNVSRWHTCTLYPRMHPAQNIPKRLNHDGVYALGLLRYS